MSSAAATTSRFAEPVTTLEQLRAVVREPGEVPLRKQIAELDHHCRAFIAHSPFALLATAGADGSCDVSPRGDAPGFALVLDDHTLALPERSGNRRLDSLQNIVANPHAGLLFCIPGRDETLRVNGPARVVRDDWLLQRLAHRGHPPVLAVVVDAAEVFLHCAKAFRRSRLWQPEHWPDTADLASTGTMLRDHTRTAATGAAVDAALEEGYRDSLGAEGYDIRR